jgi:type IV secretion system protein VirB9
MRILILVFLVVSLSSCTTSVNVKDTALGIEAGDVPQLDPNLPPVAIENPEPIVAVVERPVFVPPVENTPAAKPANPKTPVKTPVKTPAEKVRDVITQRILKPEDYDHAAVVYDFDSNLVWEVYTQRFRVTDITLKPNEKTIESPFVSDSERFILGAGIHYDNGQAVQHIYVKPTIAGLEATLIINTNERSYHIILRSYNTIHMPIVYWRYPGRLEAQMPHNYVPFNNDVVTPEDYVVDPPELNFNYKITYKSFSKPKWCPLLVYDDARKTYITFPDNINTAELPALFEERDEIVNYRVVRNIMIIDKQVAKLTLKLGKKSVLVERKLGRHNHICCAAVWHQHRLTG